MTTHKVLTAILLILAVCLGAAVFIQNRKISNAVIPQINNATSTLSAATTTVSSTASVVTSGTTTKPVTTSPITPTPKPPVKQPSSTAQTFPKQIALSVSSPYMFPNGAVLRVKEIVSDSRCASDVQCIWAGNVVVKFTINYKEFELIYTPGGIRTSYPYAGYTIWFTDVRPDRGVQSRSLTPNDYVFIMDIVK